MELAFHGSAFRVFFHLRAKPTRAVNNRYAAFFYLSSASKIERDTFDTFLITGLYYIVCCREVEMEFAIKSSWHSRPGNEAASVSADRDRGTRGCSWWGSSPVCIHTPEGLLGAKPLNSLPKTMLCPHAHVKPGGRAQAEMRAALRAASSIPQVLGTDQRQQNKYITFF